MNNPNNRRRTSFARHPVQKKYLRLVLLAMLAPTILVTACLYYLIWQTVAYELAIPELIVESLFPAFHRVNQILLIGMPLVFGVITFFAIRLSHRFAGPLYRIEKDLTDMIETHNFTKPLRIRHTDELQSLVDKINHALRIADKR